MTTTIKLLTTTAVFLAFTATTNASTFEATDHSVTTQICIAAAEGHKMRLKRIINDSGLSPYFVTNKVQCNNQNIAAFVEKYGKSPEKINNMLNRYRKNEEAQNIQLVKL